MKKIIDYLKQVIKIGGIDIDFQKITDSNYSIVTNTSKVIGACNIDKEIKITLNGNLRSLDVSCGDVTINGNVLDSVTHNNGDIEISGKVMGNVSNTNGDINIEQSVTGNVKTINGDIKYRK